MGTVTIEGATRLKYRIEKLQGKIENPKAALKETGEKLVEYFKDNMESEGVKLNKRRWEELKPFTLAMKEVGGYGSKKILERTGKLKAGIKIKEVVKDRLVISNDVSYYPVHQLGDKSLKTPQRKIMGMTDEVSKLVIDTLKKHITF